MKYKRLPLEIEAIQYIVDNKEEIIKFTNGDVPNHSIHFGKYTCIIEKYDWIVKENGKLYVCTPEMFKKTFR